MDRPECPTCGLDMPYDYGAGVFYCEPCGVDYPPADVGVEPPAGEGANDGG